VQMRKMLKSSEDFPMTGARCRQVDTLCMPIENKQIGSDDSVFSNQKASLDRSPKSLMSNARCVHYPFGGRSERGGRATPRDLRVVVAFTHRRSRVYVSGRQGLWRSMLEIPLNPERREENGTCADREARDGRWPFATPSPRHELAGNGAGSAKTTGNSLQRKQTTCPKIIQLKD
jgi:hypothetical protein